MLWKSRYDCPPAGRFSNAAYLCLFAFFTIHAIGAHYTYSLVPYDAWWQALTGQTLGDAPGWRRNHYDRAASRSTDLLDTPAAIRSRPLRNLA